MTVSPREAEGHSWPLWPLVERVPLGEWQLRTDPAPVDRLVKRANSCLAMGSPGEPLHDAADRVRDFYTARRRPAMVQVERGSDIERSFAALGWLVVAGGDSHFMLAPVAELAGRLSDRPRAGVEVEVVVEEDGPRVRVVLVAEGGEVASGRGAVEGVWLAVHALAVEPPYRRQGHALAVMTSLVRWGAARGARLVWLHVETDNAPALRLYARLGFEIHHSCRYLRAEVERT